MILIVDDLQENLYSLQRTLAAEGLDSETASSGEEALKKVLKQNFELIILDVQMPGMDGFEVAEALAGYSKAADIPILFLSAASKDKRFVTKGLHAGALDYITKPVDVDVLLLKVHNFMRLHRQTRALQLAQQSLRAEVSIRREAEALLKEKTEALQSFTNDLEAKVAARTSALMEANRQLEERAVELQQFASVASHDLKEPLRKIQVFGELSRKKFGGQIGELDDYMDRMTSAAKRMTGLINDLLYFSKLAADPDFSTVDLGVTVRGILEDLEMSIAESGATIEVGDLPVLEGVEGQIRQLFQNLVANALKFRHPDVSPKIRIWSEHVQTLDFDAPAGENGPYCRLFVEDNGIGFEEEYLGKIFTIFQRLHQQHEYEGTGIGLAIAKRIVQRHNGIITARSQPGQGATFLIVLPCEHIPTDTHAQ